MTNSKLLTSLEAVETTENLYNLIGSTLASHIPKSVVVVVHLDMQLKKGLVHGFYGLGMPWFNKLISVLGLNPVGKHFELTEEGKKYFYTERGFRKFNGSVYEFAGGQLPEWMSRSVEAIFNVRGIYTIALNSCGTPLGTVLVFNRLNKTPDFRGLEAFVNQSSDKLMQIIGRHRKELNVRELKDTFTQNLLSNLSHEIRTPLNGLLGALELAKMDAETNESIDISLFEHAWSNATLLTRHIDSLVMASELATRTIALNFRIVTSELLLRTIGRVVDALKQQYLPRGIYLKHQVSIGRHVKVDIQRMEYVIEELLVNAIKFSETDVELSVSVGDNFCICVKDNGIGMSPLETELVVAHFAKVSSCERIYRGLGLGLYICSELVHMHNGTISLHSKPKYGTTVLVSLPFVMPQVGLN